MASVTTHCFVAAALSFSAYPATRVRQAMPRWALVVSSSVLSAAPDLDLAGRRLLHVSGASMFAHRGLFHSPFFLVAAAAILAAVAVRNRPPGTWLALWLVWGGCMLTHPLLDGLTDGGRGLMLLLPVTQSRMFLPWRLIHTPPAGSAGLIWRALALRPSELPFCAVAAVCGIFGFRRGFQLRDGRVTL